jgi:hypothetical protein
VGIGCQGRITSGWIHLVELCELYKEMEKDSPGFPPPTSLTGRRKPFSYFFVTDKAYVVQENIIKIHCGLYQKGPVERLFNYRLSRTSRVVKTVFGITSSYSRVLRKALLLQPEQVDLF